MSDRIKAEVELARTLYPALDYRDEGHWIRVPNFKLPERWSKRQTELVFQFPQTGYPQSVFYGFYVESGLRFNGATPKNFTDPSPAKLPFAGAWAFFSGNPDPWTPAPAIEDGSNVLSWLHSVSERFQQGVGSD
jgi:hypothetical protein